MAEAEKNVPADAEPNEKVTPAEAEKKTPAEAKKKTPAEAEKETPAEAEKTPAEAEKKTPGEAEKAEANGATKAVSSDVEKKIIRQVEYYFGDWNLPRDRFLQEQLKMDDGWIPMDVMTRFQRLAQLSMDHSVIASALRKSTSELVEVSEDGTKIRRSLLKPVPENSDERRKELQLRTIYVKGFDKEASVLDELMEYFKQFGTLENLHMRSYNDKATKKHCFKGSVFALFNTEKEAQDFMKLESVEYKGEKLICKWQADYFEEKSKERAENSKKKGSKDKGKSKQAQKAKKKDSDTTMDVSEEGAKKEETEEDEFPRNAVLYMSGCPPSLTREDIKAKFFEMGTAVAYVDFKRGDEVGWIRLQEANSAPEFMKKIGESGVLKLCDADVSLRVIEGEEETNFLQRVKVDMEKVKMKTKFNKRGRRGGRGGGFRGKKRKGGFQHGGSPAKKAHTD